MMSNGLRGKRRVRIAGALVGLVALAGCGTPGGSGGSGSGQISLRMTWWGNPARATATQQAVALFEKAHPNITVQTEPSAYPSYYDKLNTEITAGTAPDVFQADVVVQYAAKGSLADLGAYQDTLKVSGLPTPYLAQGSYDNKLYEIPAGSNLYALLYSADAVSKAGATAPTAGMTWQQYGQLAQQISKAGGGKTWGAGDDSYNTQVFEIFARQRGGNLYSADGKSLGFKKQDLVDWWQYWADLRKSGAVPPPDVTEPSVAGDITKAPIAKGLVAMDAFGTSTTLPGTSWKYVALPGEDGHPGLYLKRSVNWALYAHSKHPKEAAQLIDFLINDKQAGLKLGMTRGAPANGDVLAALRPTLSGPSQEVAAYTAYAAQKGHNSTPPPPAPAASKQVEIDLFARLAENVWFGKSSVDAAAQQFMDQAGQVLAQGS